MTRLTPDMIKDVPEDKIDLDTRLMQAAGKTVKGIALEAAGLNVAVNTRLMADRAHAAELDARAGALRAEYLPRAEAVYANVSKRLGGN